jgi:hypothetical protein
VEVVDAKTGKLLYSRGFSTVFAEWRSTEEAAHANRGFQESVRFPRPEQPVRCASSSAMTAIVSVVWTADVDPNAMDVIRKLPPAPVKPIGIRVNGPSPTRSIC